MLVDAHIERIWLVKSNHHRDHGLVLRLPSIQGGDHAE
jgi:hypothetical protein